LLLLRADHNRSTPLNPRPTRLLTKSRPCAEGSLFILCTLFTQTAVVSSENEINNLFLVSVHSSILQ